MPAQKKTATGLFAALLGVLGFSVIAGLLVTVMVAPAIAVTGVTANSTIGIFNSLPDYFVLDTQHQRNQFVAIDSKGKTIPIADIYDQNRQEVDLAQISKNAQYAAIDGEDRRFYDHGGVDVASAIRAAITNASGTGSSGGSTLSMQLVRNILVLRAVNDTSLTQAQRDQAVYDATYPDINRKLKEMKYAIGLEKKYSKDEILAGYLNIVGMGGNTYGIEAGAEQFFNTTAAKLTPAQAASLIAIVQNPNHLTLNDPANYPANEKRRNVILGWMYADGHIDKKQYDEAIATKVDKKFVTPTAPKNGCLSAAISYRWPCDYAYTSILNGEVPALGATREEQLANFHKGGYTFVLTINPGLQNVATQQIHASAPNTEARFQLGAAASTVQVGTGNILVMAQNKDFNNTKKGGGRTTTAVNFNADIGHGGGSGFQPGSSYKPYTLLNFLKTGHGLNEVFNASVRTLQKSDFPARCAPNGGGSFTFKNDDGESGPYTVMRGTARSVNSVFLQMGTEVDQCDTKDIAISLGVHRGDGAADGSDLETLPSCVIGGCDNNITPLTQAAAYAAIANQGVFCKPIIIKQVLAADGTKLPGQDADCGQSSQVAPNVANTAAYAMQGVMVGNGTAIASNPRDGTVYIAKTGTTDAAVHTWMVGSSTAASTAVWVGNIKGTQNLRSIYVGSHQAAVLRHVIFKPIAQAIDKTYPGHAFPGADPKLLTGIPVFVPDNLVGLTAVQAQTAIQAANLTYKSGGQIDSDLPAGQVAKTSPASGASVPRGSIVTVWTSNGLAVPVPDVVSGKLSYDDAAAKFNAAGFMNVDPPGCVAFVPAPDPDADDPSTLNTVVAQDPAAGSTVNKNKHVTLTVRRMNCP